jgi:hypothetical protein
VQQNYKQHILTTLSNICFWRSLTQVSKKNNLSSFAAWINKTTGKTHEYWSRWIEGSKYILQL